MAKTSDGLKRPFPTAVAVFILCAVIGLVVFGIMARRATSIERLTPPDAAYRIESIRRRFADAGPVLRLAPDGTVISRRAPSHEGGAPIAAIVVITYDLAAARLTETRIPFWFFRIKAPAAEYAFGDTGLDFRRLGVTAADLRRYGPALIVDHTTTAGGRLVVWTE